MNANIIDAKRHSQTARPLFAIRNNDDKIYRSDPVMLKTTTHHPMCRNSTKNNRPCAIST